MTDGDEKILEEVLPALVAMGLGMLVAGYVLGADVGPLDGVVLFAIAAAIAFGAAWMVLPSMRSVVLRRQEDVLGRRDGDERQ